MSSQGSASSKRPLTNGSAATNQSHMQVEKVGRDVVSCPNSSLSMRTVNVDHVEDVDARNMSMYTHVDNHFDGTHDLLTPENTTLVQRHIPGNERPDILRNPRFWISQTLAVIVSSVILLAVVCVGLMHRSPGLIPRLIRLKGTPLRSWDCHGRWKGEKLVKSPQYYARSCGFDIADEQVETKDGYYLRMHRVICNDTEQMRRGPGKGYPILILHGLFQSSGSFITSEERSLAFWLAAQGYQVYLGNNRAAYDMGHRRFSRYAPEFWDYNIRDLALYDLPAMVDYVRQRTGYEKIAFIGHSQGNATAFIALSRWFVPELGTKLSYFGALAPAVFAGPLTKCFPLSYMCKLDWPTWRRLFGVLDFIPLMKCMSWVSFQFRTIGRPLRHTRRLATRCLVRKDVSNPAYLFEWNDTNWLSRRKPKMFRFTPQPVSSAAMFWWGGKDSFVTRGSLFEPDQQWFEEHFPPLALYGGGRDRLVLTQPLVEHIRKHEPNVRLLRVKIQPEAEHCDHYWAADAVEWCFMDIVGTWTINHQMISKIHDVIGKTLSWSLYNDSPLPS